MSTHDGNTVQHTADVALFARDDDRMLHVLLIQRHNDSDAYPNVWALPGGYLEPGEHPEHAARRELTEETGVFAPHVLTLVGSYNYSAHGPRGPVHSTVYAALLQDMPVPRAGDDAQRAAWTPVPLAFERPLAFEHAISIRHALRRIFRYSKGT